MVDHGGQPCGVRRSVAEGKMLGPPFTQVDACVRALARRNHTHRLARLNRFNFQPRECVCERDREEASAGTNVHAPTDLAKVGCCGVDPNLHGSGLERSALVVARSLLLVVGHGKRIAAG
jgi:hypothetical protein